MTACPPPELERPPAHHRNGEVPTADALDRALREYGAAVARRESKTALDALDGLSPAQRRTVAVLAGRLAAGVLAPPRRGLDAATDANPAVVATLFGVDAD